MVSAFEKPQPVATAVCKSPMGDADIEKSGQAKDGPISDNSDVPGDNESGELQQGVERVRAITAIWNKTTMVSMFIL